MPDQLIPGKKRTMAYSKSSGFKMKGSPMQRNFGISPVKDVPDGLREVGQGFKQMGQTLAQPFVKGYRKAKKVVKKVVKKYKENKKN